MTHTFRSACFIAFVASTLAACTGDTPPPQASTTLSDDAQPAAPAGAPAPNGAPAFVETAPLSDNGSLAPLAPAPMGPAPLPSDITGQNPAEVQEILGEPSLVRRDGHVQIMQYAYGMCVLDIVFYEPEPGRHFSANHVAARTNSGGTYDTATCLTSIYHGQNSR